MKSQIIFTIIACVFLCNNVVRGGEAAPGFSISGKIIDKNNNTAIEYANVVLYNTESNQVITGTITNTSGVFEFKNLSQGKYYLLIQFVGYKPFKTQDFDLSAKNKKLDLGNLIIESLVNELSEVTVGAEKQQTEYKIDKTVINVEKNINAQSGTALDVLQTTPSVKSDVNGDITLRGSSNFIVLVDGKPSVFQGSDALRQIPASQINKIEMITNPSAKYNPEGTSGIINIITKKQSMNGLNGVINASAGTGDKYSTDIMLNYTKTKANFYLGADYRHMPFLQKFIIDRTYKLGDTLYNNLENSYQDNTRPSGNIKLGMDYNFNDKNIFSTNHIIGKSGFYRDFGFEFVNSDVTHQLKQYSTSMQLYDLDAYFYNPSINYTHKFTPELHEISAEASYVYVEGGYFQSNIQNLTDAYYNPSDIYPINSQANNTFSRNEYNGKVDYKKKINDKVNLESGIHTSFNSKTVMLNFENYNSNTQTWQNDTSISNLMNYRQNTYAAYATLAGEIKKFGYQVGLRLEETDREMEQKSLNQNFIYQQFHLFPTIHISRPLSETFQMQLSYSRRIQRPYDFWLNPFPSTSNTNLKITGNPYLKPEFTDSYEFNLQKTIKKTTLSINNFYRKTTDALSQVTTLNNEGVQVLTFGNVGYNKFIGSELSASYSYKKWLNINPGLSIFYSISDGLIGTYNAHFESMAINPQINASITIKENTRIQLIASYNSKGITQQGTMDPFYNISVSLRQDFFKKKLTAVLQVRNLFNSNKLFMNEQGTNFTNQLTVIPEKNWVTLSVSYKINRMKRNARLQQNNMDITI